MVHKIFLNVLDAACGIMLLSLTNYTNCTEIEQACYMCHITLERKSA